MKIKLLCLLSLLLLNYKGNSQMRIVTIGNSITQGSNFDRTGGKTEFSYRPWLWNKLTIDGLNVDMVGYHPYFFGEKQGNLNMNFPSASGKSFDRDNEAYYGINSSSFVNGDGSSGWTGSPLPKFSDRINDPNKGYTPDFALIHIGTNDADDTPAKVLVTENNIKEMIKILRTKNPNIVILLAKLITNGKKINGEIDRISKEVTTAQSPVVVVDLATGFNFLTMAYPNDVHPNEMGQKFMMRGWYNALMANLNDKLKPTLENKLTANNVTETSASLNWSLASDNYGVKTYEVYANNAKIATLNNKLQLPYTAQNLSKGTNYTFKVVAKDFGGNASDTAIFVAKTSGVTSTEEELKMQNIQVFPSPSNGPITITGINNASIKVADMAGKTVLDFSNISGSLNLTSLPNGIYYLQILNDGFIITRKVIIQK